MCLEVRRPSQRAAVAGCYLVRRSSGIQTEEHGGAASGSCQTRGNVSGLQYHLHDSAHFANGTVYEEAICEIHMSFRVVRFLPK